MKTNSYETLSSDRANAIAACDPALSPEQVREICCYDWPNWDEHIEWVNTAPAQEIAEWVSERIADQN